MKILMVNNYLYRRGGAESVMLEEMAGLAERGHEVAAFSARHPQNEPSPLEHLFPDVADLQTRSLVEKVARGYSVVANLAVKRAFSRAIDVFRPDLVHFHNIYGRLTPVVAEVAHERGVPSVLTAHDYKLVCPTYLRLSDGRPCTACSYRNPLPVFFRRCHKGSRVTSIVYGVEAAVNSWRGAYDGIDAIVCPSRFMQQALSDGGVGEMRLRLVPNSAPLAAPARASAGGPPYLLFAGRLSREKGVACLIRALDGLDVDLLIAGDGPEAPALRQLAARTRQPSRIRFIGHCPRSTIVELHAGAFLVVVPSEWYENAPMSVLEAFAAGKPVVGAAIGGIPELVRPGETGTLFPPGDPARLQDALRGLLASPATVARMGENARQMVKDRFSPDVHLQELLKTYAEVLT
jgi:glycosyltransferase involved in cell wall biosynthesis